MRLVIAEVEILVICTGIYLGNIAISLLGGRFTTTELVIARFYCNLVLNSKGRKKGKLFVCMGYK